MPLQLSLGSYFKITLSFYQVVAAIPTVYEAHLPREYKDIIPTWLNTDLFELSVPGTCVGSFSTRLLLRALVPLLALAVLAALAVAATAARDMSSSAGGAVTVLMTGLVRVLPVLLLLTYVLLPSVANGALLVVEWPQSPLPWQPRSPSTP